MCGRFALSVTPARFRELFGCPPPAGYAARWNIAPDSEVVAIRRRADGGREAAWLRWGLLAPWMRDPRDPGRQINARAETAGEKPMFRAAFRARRCLLPADGFYEWRRRGRGASRPHFVRLDGDRPMAMAGIWERIRLTDGGILDTVAILTRPAVPEIRDIHHRMPVVLPEERWDAWLDPELSDPALLRELLLSEDVTVGAFPVSRRVNSPANDDPGLLDPEPEDAVAEAPRQGRLF